MNFRERIEAGRNNQHGQNDSDGNISNVADFMAANGSGDDADGAADFNFYSTENHRSQPACVDLRFADGSRIALPYSYIMEMKFDPSDGIVILTSARKVKITGRDLCRLYEYLVLYRVKYVQENIGADLTEEGLFVKGIEVREV